MHSLRTLLADLAPLTLNKVVLPQAPEHWFPLHARPTPVQQKAFDLLGVDPTRIVASNLMLTSGLFRRLVPELFRQQDGPVSRINPLLPEERVPSGGGFGVYPKELCSSGLLVCVHNILISNHLDGNLM